VIFSATENFIGLNSLFSSNSDYLVLTE